MSDRGEGVADTVGAAGVWVAKAVRATAASAPLAVGGLGVCAGCGSGWFWLGGCDGSGGCAEYGHGCEGSGGSLAGRKGQW